MSSKKIYFYEYEPNHLYEYKSGREIYHGYEETFEAIESNIPVINTTQMSLLSTSLIEKGYRIIVVPCNKPIYEITLGQCQNTDREIRKEHNLFRMWENGEWQ